MRRLIVSVVLASLVASSPAAAGDDDYHPAAYAVTVGELATAGVFLLNFGTSFPNQGPALVVNFAPLLLAPGAGLGAHFLDLDPRPALAIHGATWLGFDLFLLGALIDGRDKVFGLRAGTFAWSLGALGAVAGGVIGATAIDDRDKAAWWLAAPGTGFLLGGLVIGGGLVLASGLDGDQAAGRLALGAATGLGIGLGVATYLAYRGDDAASLRAAPLVDPTTRRFLVSFGGSF